jgi:hypothetical protein
VRRWIVFLAVSQLVMGADPAGARVQRALLSVDNLNLRSNVGIRRFHIKTWGVEYLAVCHLPASWEIKSEKFQDPEGWLDGKSDTHGERLTGLQDMFLVDVYDYQPLPKGDPRGDYHPPSFAGWVQLGNRADEVPNLGKLTLQPSHFHLRPARNCPAARPAKP